MLFFAVLACEGTKMKGADTEKKAAPPKKITTEAASGEDKKSDSLDANASDPNATAVAGAEGDSSSKGQGQCVNGKKISLDGPGKIINSKDESNLSSGSSDGQCNTSCHMLYSSHRSAPFNGHCGDTSSCRVPGTKDDSQCQKCVFEEPC